VSRKSLVLDRAVEILDERGGITRAELVRLLAPLVQPGVAFRLQEKRVQVLRESRGHQPRKWSDEYRNSTQYKIEVGARSHVGHMITSWTRSGILEETLKSGDKFYTLRRRPGTMSAPMGAVAEQEKILEAIRRFAQEHGRPPRSKEWEVRDRNGYPDRRSVVYVFGTWKQAILAAGFTLRRSRGRSRGSASQQVPSLKK